MIYVPTYIAYITTNALQWRALRDAASTVSEPPLALPGNPEYDVVTQ